MGTVSFRHVYKAYKGEENPSVKNFHLEVGDGEFLVLVGPSGCGKSTTLRMLAGLEEITDGEIYIDDKFINYVSPKNRDIAMVFQNYALYPNLSIYENIALGLRLRKVDKHEIELKVNRVARALEIDHLLERRPNQLSGGQKQRVALGRAMVRDPKVFLMDEPLSNLDAKLRAQTRAELIRMHANLQTTTVYVTHDQVEAMTMGTRIVVMKSGEIQQVDSPQQLYDYPSNMFVASFIGTPQMNFVQGRLTREQNRFYFETKRWRLPLPSAFTSMLEASEFKKNDVVLGMRSEHIQLENECRVTEAEWVIEAKIEMKELMGSDTYLTADVSHDKLTLRAESHTDVQIGDQVRIHLRLDKAHLFSGETKQSILYSKGVNHL
ncbi:ABC transporter ATP-binding protein [Paenibacillus baekrokdamisoli]|uniref:ABC transporter ATP-binding protein n=1 Tax=Paenibacillus baekrokdamisoli TaxID=1712516 RepID=A0A3G9J1B9_9BACL|nr:sn-glycerol-3-phosphate ABC transporter ATP-binding protein UgpC [Paenibacillus baekrokdamisoli]MBB3070896.1 multiple sugar transport system ATP-binding protein [Paenibacillus baekrokdamisoli]BBH22165.1 ABC transporter ATP-binding protein [Paenibacillus baekrokdamisoli]